MTSKTISITWFRSEESSAKKSSSEISTPEIVKQGKQEEMLDTNTQSSVDETETKPNEKKLAVEIDNLLDEDSFKNDDIVPSSADTPPSNVIEPTAETSEKDIVDALFDDSANYETIHS